MKDGDGNTLAIGDTVAFKCDVEQSGRIKFIRGDEVGLVPCSDEGFMGSYISRSTIHWTTFDRVWKEDY